MLWLKLRYTVWLPPDFFAVGLWVSSTIFLYFVKNSNKIFTILRLMKSLLSSIKAVLAVLCLVMSASSCGSDKIPQQLFDESEASV